MSRRTTKQRKSAARRRAYYKRLADFVAGPVFTSMTHAVSYFWNEVRP